MAAPDLLMADALYPLGIPKTLPLVAVGTEVDNTSNPAAMAQLLARFPALAAAGRVLPIVVNPADAGAVRVSTVAEDQERGALSIQEAAAGVEANPTKPIVCYVNRFERDLLEAAVGGFRPPAAWPSPGPYLWLADWTGFLHMDRWAVAVQFLATGVYDLSAINPACSTFPIVAPPTPPPPRRFPEMWPALAVDDTGQEFLVYPLTGTPEIVKWPLPAGTNTPGLIAGGVSNWGAQAALLGALRTV